MLLIYLLLRVTTPLHRRQERALMRIIHLPVFIYRFLILASGATRRFT